MNTKLHIDESAPVVDHAEFLRKRQRRLDERAVKSNVQSERALLALEASLNAIVDQIAILAATHETSENILGPRMIFLIECMKAAAKERLGLQPKRQE
jgi:hypothetical protein